jgi:hypothetical protein
LDIAGCMSKASWIALTLLLQRILGSLALGHVDDTVHVEADLLRVRGPVLVAEAVLELAVMGGSKRVVA